jgi:hypothetical protein
MRRLRMRNKFVLSVLLVVLASASVWAQFWKTYDDRERRTVGEAYWLAGKQYQSVGKTEKGGQYMALARQIYPQLDPSQISDQSFPSAAELLAQGKATVIGEGAAAVPTGAVNSFFLRFLGTLVARDADGVTGFLDGSVYITKIPEEATRDQARAALKDWFADASNEAGAVRPSAVYDLDSIVVARASPAMQAAWGETYTLTVNAKADYSPSVSFWDPEQRFYLHRVSGAWSIFAIGQAAPPLSWVPHKAAPVVGTPPEAAEGDPGKDISSAFLGFMTALLMKDADGATDAVSENVRFLRVRQTVTREELKTTLLGYYEKPSFAEAVPADALDLDSLFVEPADSPVDGVPGPVYMLNVKAREDLSSGLPIWSTYQSYYFVNEGGDWKIFAILI